MSMKKKALVLFSWWLDSLLTIKILEAQWIEVTALTYETPFFKAKKAIELSKHYWFKHIVKDISEPHFEVVKNPKYWYWKNMNPCIDCHWFMFRIARNIANELWISIIASWEVFWQRPFSQNKQALIKVRVLAWCDILMPLSAKLLDETTYEKQWLVNRNKFYDISWKSRKVQLELIKRFNIDKFSNPWWWCILTTKEYSDKLSDLLFNFNDKVSTIDAEIIKLWRCHIFEIWNKKYFWVMWRNQGDNDHIEDIWSNLNKDYYIINFVEIAWPRVILITFWQKITDKLLKEVVSWMISKTTKAKDMNSFKIKMTCLWHEEEKIINY